MVNTAPLAWGDRLFATWDVGRPAEIDPLSLRFLGEVGSADSWGGGSFPAKSVLPFIFSSAHPVVDPDRGCLWTAKLVPGDGAPFRWRPIVVRWDGDGASVRTWPVAGARLAGSMHTVSQTRDWLILADSGNFKADPGEMAGGARSARIDDVVPVFLVRKDELESTPPGREVPMRELALAPSTGHYYACWEDRDGVRVLFEHMDLVDLALRLQPRDRDARGRPIDPALAGMYNMAMAPSSVSEVELDPASGKLTHRAAFREEWAWNLQLSALDWSPAGLSAPTLHHTVYQGWRPGAVSERALHHYRDRIDRDRLPPEDTPSSLVTRRRGSLEVTSRFEFRSAGDLPTSPVFVPRAAAAGPRRDVAPGGHDGFVACPVLSDAGLRVDLFDAADVARGPLASIGAPGEAVPLLLHSAWLARAVAAPERERLRFSDDVGADALAALPPELADTVRELARGREENVCGR
jgi:carotenoid cleavage dioxygenase-like enzyme